MEDNHLSGMDVTSVPCENDALHLQNIRYKCMEVVRDLVFFKTAQNDKDTMFSKAVVFIKMIRSKGRIVPKM